MAKKAFILLSILLNIILGTLLWSKSKDRQIANAELARVDQARLKDITQLEKLFQNTLSKDSVYSILKNKFNDEEWFDKPEEKGIGLSFLFLVFDEDQKLAKIQADTLAGK